MSTPGVGTQSPKPFQDMQLPCEIGAIGPRVTLALSIFVKVIACAVTAYAILKSEYRLKDKVIVSSSWREWEFY